jgi:hypothetical protein
MENLDWSFDFEKVNDLKSEYLVTRPVTSKVDIFSIKDLVNKFLPGNIKIYTLIDSHGSPEIHFINQNQEGYYLKNSRLKPSCCFIINFDYRRRFIHLDEIDLLSFAKFSKAYFHLLSERLNRSDIIVDNQIFSKLKEEKIRNIAEKSIELSLQPIIKNLDCEYFIEKSSSGITLNVKLSRKRKLTISISYKSFQKQLPVIAKTINEFQRIDKESGLLTTVTNSSNLEKWIKSEASHGN